MGRIKSEAGVGGVRRGPKSKAKCDLVKTGFDGPAENPWRRTATIFKQPITIVHSTRKDTRETPPSVGEKLKKLANLSTDRPLPLFWSKCFERNSAMIPIHKCDKTSRTLIEKGDEYICVKANLPENVTPYASNILNSEDSLITYISALTPSTPSSHGIVGQKEQTLKKTNDSPYNNANYEQPLVLGISKVTDADITRQEEKVLLTRKRLQQLRESFCFKPSVSA